MQAPPHGVAGAVQNIVGVQVEPVGQGPLLPTVQGICGGRVGVLMQRPPQVEVWVQIEPVGQGSPPRIQEDRGGLGLVACVRVKRPR